MEQMRFTNAIKEDIQEELMYPITEWFNEEQNKIIQEEEEKFEKLHMLCEEYGKELARVVESLDYEMQNRGVNLATFESQLVSDIEYVCTSKLDRVRGNKKLIQLHEQFIVKSKEVNKVLMQIELECALGIGRKDFMELLDSYKKILIQDL